MSNIDTEANKYLIRFQKDTAKTMEQSQYAETMTENFTELMQDTTISRSLRTP